jgi:error-prone DNA polymerase
LLTLGNLRAEKEKCYLYKRDVYEHAEGQHFIIVPPAKLSQDFEFELVLSITLRITKPTSLIFIAATKYYTGDDNKRLFS